MFVEALHVSLLQEDNGMPIHLKGGSSDAILYRMTMVLTVLGERILLLLFSPSFS